MNRRSFARLFAIAFLTSCAGSSARSPARAGIGPDEAATTITATDMHDRIAFLAADSLLGRDTPSPGLETAARYVADAFASFGLEPGGDDGAWLQRYPLPLLALDTTAVRLEIVGPDGKTRTLRFGEDYFVSPGGSPGGEAAVRGRLAVAGVPGGFDRDFRQAVERARRAARAAGAPGLVVVLGPDFPAAGLRRFAEHSARPRRVLADPAEIPVFYVAREAFPGGPELPASVEAVFAANTETLDEARPPNVVGILRGSDPALRDTWVVFSAHMDHVGVGTADANGDSIYNGADDDASGTAAVVEVAQAFAALSKPPARSLIFLTVSGEEKGLLGSRWFSDHAPVPVDAIVADINVDMIGRNAPDSVIAIGLDYSSLGPLVRRVAREHPDLGLAVAPDQMPEERLFFRSDHFNFARKEIPALFLFTGLHDDYHRPSDEVEKIDAGKAARVARLVFRTAWEIAMDPERPEWVPAGLEEVRALTR